MASDSPINPSTFSGSAAASRPDHSASTLKQVGKGLGIHLFDKPKMVHPKQMPLPGVVIFVHGVNSEGEWFAAAEAGLCKGLNRRLGRLDAQMAYKGVDAGQMAPVSYMRSLTLDGYINPKLTAETFIKADPSFSPVIHFRWGYKADADGLKEYGANTYLNERNYWGGGPFANGCSSLPDLWTAGLDDRFFGWIKVQALNTTDRQVYKPPGRQYMVMAALRLAKLIESIRTRQADVAITVVCHSQGNMVGMTAAFFGDRMPEVTDPVGKKGKCVADAYVQASAPYSLVADSWLENWVQRTSKDAQGRRGRETSTARTDTLKNFFEILRQRAAFEPDPNMLDQEMANTIAPSTGNGKAYSAAADRKSHGLKNHTYGRVTLYCCPHDQVISAATIQGIGWLGLSKTQIEKTGGEGVFTQRVFASGYDVGQEPGNFYRYWADDWRHKVNVRDGFFYPPSPTASFGFKRQWRANPSSETLTGMAGIGNWLLIAKLLVRTAVNAEPDKHWEIPVIWGW